jgi:hypothetical protein
MALEGALGEHENTILHDFEHTSTPLQQLDRCVGICFPNLGRQTGGPGFVVSNDAVADTDVHVGRGVVSVVAEM